MLANGGRITNHDLVKSYKRWLTDPQEKENARAQFKDYVNTLATIKQENGEKYLLLKKKFYPEYIANNCNTFDSYSSDNNFNSADIQNINPNYPPTNSSSRKASSNYHDPYQQQSLGYHQQPSSYDPPGVGSYSRQSSYSSGLGPSSLTTSSSHLAPSSATNGNNSPSLLDEVMAGWAPPSRRQLPSVPAPASTPLHGHNSLGLPSVGVPSYSRQTSVDNMPRGDTLHYNSGFNPHVSHHQSEQGGYRSSVASVASGYSSSGGNSYHGSPRHVPGYTSPPSSFTSSGSPRGSVSQRSSFSSIPHHASQSSLSQSSRAPPPYRAPPPEPVSSSSRTSESRLPPPPPPSSEPVHSIQQRPLPSRPSELHLNNHHPTDPILPSPGSSSPPPPPRRTIPSDPVYSPQHPPPPLPKRQLPSTANLQPLDLGLPIQNLSSAGSRGKHPSTNNNHHHKLSQESQQPSPTDSGFTEDSSKFSDYPMPRNSSLSKSIGNLTSSNNTNSDSKVEKIEGSQSLDNLDSLPGKEDEKISVRERTKTFNRMASETELPNNPPSSSSAGSRLPPAVKRRNSRAVEPGLGGVRRFSNRHDHDDTTDSSSITTIDPTVKQWMVHTSKGDYQTAAKMLTENPKLARHRDFTNGYTGLHWAAKHGNLDMVKLLAGTYQANVNVKSHGGYTPLHIAAQHNHQEVFDLLVQVFKHRNIFTAEMVDKCSEFHEGCDASFSLCYSFISLKNVSCMHHSHDLLSKSSCDMNNE